MTMRFDCAGQTEDMTGEEGRKEGRKIHRSTDITILASLREEAAHVVQCGPPGTFD